MARFENSTQGFPISTAIFLILISSTSGDIYQYSYGNFDELFINDLFIETTFRELNADYGVTVPDGSSVDDGGAFMLDEVTSNCIEHSFNGQYNATINVEFWCSGNEQLTIKTMSPCPLTTRLLCDRFSQQGWYQNSFDFECTSNQNIPFSFCGSSAQGNAVGYSSIIVLTDGSTVPSVLPSSTYELTTSSLATQSSFSSTSQSSTSPTSASQSSTSPISDSQSSTSPTSASQSSTSTSQSSTSPTSDSQSSTSPTSTSQSSTLQISSSSSSISSSLSSAPYSLSSTSTVKSSTSMGSTSTTSDVPTSTETATTLGPESSGFLTPAMLGIVSMVVLLVPMLLVLYCKRYQGPSSRRLFVVRRPMDKASELSNSQVKPDTTAPKPTSSKVSPPAKTDDLTSIHRPTPQHQPLNPRYLQDTSQQQLERPMVSMYVNDGYSANEVYSPQYTNLHDQPELNLKQDTFIPRRFDTKNVNARRNYHQDANFTKYNNVRSNSDFVAPNRHLGESLYVSRPHVDNLHTSPKTTRVSTFYGETQYPQPGYNGGVRFYDQEARGTKYDGKHLYEPRPNPQNFYSRPNISPLRSGRVPPGYPKFV